MGKEDNVGNTGYISNEKNMYVFFLFHLDEYFERRISIEKNKSHQ